MWPAGRARGVLGLAAGWGSADEMWPAASQYPGCEATAFVEINGDLVFEQ